MSMHNSVLLKEQEGIVRFPDPIHGGSQAKLPFLELSGGEKWNHQFLTVAKESEGLAKGNIIASHFPISSGDGRTDEHGGRANNLHTLSSAQAASMEYHKLGFGQPLIGAQYPYAEQCYGVYSAYGTQIPGRIMLPLSMASEGLPIFVNAKQYNGIMRRRKSRAKAEICNQTIKNRKPFLHLSRHLHAVRRPRGTGGRFLNAKNSDGGGEKKINKQENLHPQSTDQSQISEVLQCDEAKNNTNGSRSTSPCSEVTSYLHHFQFNNLQASFNQPFLDLGNTGLGIATATGSNYLEV